MNTAYLKATKTTESEVLNQRFLEDHLEKVLQDPEKVKLKLHESLYEVQNSENPIKNEVMRCHLNSNENTERFWQFIHTPISDGHDELQYIIHTLQDVTDLLTSKEKREKNTKSISSRVSYINKTGCSKIK